MYGSHNTCLQLPNFIGQTCWIRQVSLELKWPPIDVDWIYIKIYWIYWKYWITTSFLNKILTIGWSTSLFTGIRLVNSALPAPRCATALAVFSKQFLSTSKVNLQNWYNLSIRLSQLASCLQSRPHLKCPKNRREKVKQKKRQPNSFQRWWISMNFPSRHGNMVFQLFLSTSRFLLQMSFAQSDLVPNIDIYIYFFQWTNIK